MKDDYPGWLSGAYLRVLDLRDMQARHPGKAVELQKREAAVMKILARAVDGISQADNSRPVPYSPTSWERKAQIYALYCREEVESAVEDYAQYAYRATRSTQMDHIAQAIAVSNSNNLWTLSYLKWCAELKSHGIHPIPSKSHFYDLRKQHSPK